MHNMFHLTKYQRDHTCRKRTCLLPWSVHVMYPVKSWSCSKNIVSECSGQRHAWRMQFTRISRDNRSRGTLKRLTNCKADCFTLLKRITKLKCVNSEFRSVDINPTTEVPSSGSMAPCWSHHGNHTRQEWIIIWSDRNWILWHAC